MNFAHLSRHDARGAPPPQKVPINGNNHQRTLGARNRNSFPLGWSKVIHPTHVLLTISRDIAFLHPTDFPSEIVKKMFLPFQLPCCGVPGRWGLQQKPPHPAQTTPSQNTSDHRWISPTKIATTVSTVIKDYKNLHAKDTLRDCLARNNI